MNEIIYLEPDNDIASVIGRIKEVKDDHLALVIPRGGTIAQSVVNLKLLKRESDKLGKEITLVTNDKISKNLASQVGMTVYDNVNEAKKAVVPLKVVKNEIFQERPIVTPQEFSDPAGIKINRYNKDMEEAESIQEYSEEEKKDETENEELIEQPENKPAKNQEPQVKEKVVEKHITHEVIKEVNPKNDNHIDDLEKSNINPISPSEVEEYDKKMTATYASSRKNISSRRKPLLIILGIFIIAILGMAYYLLPKAEVKLTLKTDDLAANVEMIIDTNEKSANLESMVIPGEKLSLEKELVKDVASSGKKNVGTKASGEITFYNYWDASSQTLPAGTELTASGLKFVTDSAITVPGATITLQAGALKTNPGTVNGKITAAQAGENYNIDPSKFVVSSFSGEKREKLYGQSSQKLAGGTTKEVVIVAEEDITKAKAELVKEIEASSSEELNNQAVKDNKKVIASSIKNEEVSFQSNAKAGDESTNFKTTLKLKTTIIAFSEDEVKNIIKEKVKKDIGDSQMIVNPDELNIEYDVVSTDQDKGNVKLLVKYKGKTSKLISKEDVIAKIQGKKFGMAKIEAEKIDGVEKAEIAIWPSLLARVPYVKNRIIVNFGYQE